MILVKYISIILLILPIMIYAQTTDDTKKERYVVTNSSYKYFSAWENVKSTLDLR